MERKQYHVVERTQEAFVLSHKQDELLKSSQWKGDKWSSPKSIMLVNSYTAFSICLALSNHFEYVDII